VRDDSKEDRGSVGSSGGFTRRRLIGLGVAAAAGGLVAYKEARSGRKAKTGGGKVAVLRRCRRCTGCVAVCPEAAISLAPGCRIVVSDEKCTRCGYCVAACPVDALRVTREPGNG
jgi:ferredoxin